MPCLSAQRVKYIKYPNSGQKEEGGGGWGGGGGGVSSSIFAPLWMMTETLKYDISCSNRASWPTAIFQIWNQDVNTEMLHRHNDILERDKVANMKQSVPSTTSLLPTKSPGGRHGIFMSVCVRASVCVCE